MNERDRVSKLERGEKNIAGVKGKGKETNGRVRRKNGKCGWGERRENGIEWRETRRK